jgi:hypothetical protein
MVWNPDQNITIAVCLPSAAPLAVAAAWLRPSGESWYASLSHSFEHALARATVLVSQLPQAPPVGSKLANFVHRKNN